jgi:hypothetical protein
MIFRNLPLPGLFNTLRALVLCGLGFSGSKPGGSISPVALHSMEAVANTALSLLMQLLLSCSQAGSRMLLLLLLLTTLNPSIPFSAALQSPAKRLGSRFVRGHRTEAGLSCVAYQQHAQQARDASENAVHTRGCVARLCNESTRHMSAVVTTAEDVPDLSYEELTCLCKG